MPFSKQQDADPISKVNPEVLSMLQNFENSNPGNTRILAPSQLTSEDFTLASLLVIQGRQDVHKLLDFLINFSGPQNDDVPAIYSPSPFIGATLKSLEVVKNLVVQSSEFSSKQQTLYSMQITGWLLPITILRLCQLFKKTQGDFHVLFWNENNHSSSFLNALSNQTWSWLFGDGYDELDCIPLCNMKEVKLAAEHAITNQSKKNFISIPRMKCINGQFSIALS